MDDWVLDPPVDWVIDPPVDWVLDTPVDWVLDPPLDWVDWLGGTMVVDPPEDSVTNMTS